MPPKVEAGRRAKVWKGKRHAPETRPKVAADARDEFARRISTISSTGTMFAHSIDECRSSCSGDANEVTKTNWVGVENSGPARLSRNAGTSKLACGARCARVPEMLSMREGHRRAWRGIFAPQTTDRISTSHDGRAQLSRAPTARTCKKPLRSRHLLSGAMDKDGAWLKAAALDETRAPPGKADCLHRQLSIHRL